ncbi:MAG TPA: hypothetical protein VH251_03855, partial [Verrucomicrobiae bacterium]|nr:hypothetical protein [Verrucomicrobiae bacterium]
CPPTLRYGAASPPVLHFCLSRAFAFATLLCNKSMGQAGAASENDWVVRQVSGARPNVALAERQLGERRGHDPLKNQ